MEVPPTFSAPPPPKRTNTLLIVILVILGVCVLCCAGIGFFGYKMTQKMGGAVSCIMHYSLALDATKKYAAAHGDKLPDAGKWQDEIADYYARDRKSDQSMKGFGMFDFGDPAKDLGCAAGTDGPATGIAFNADLAGKTVEEARKDPSTPIFFEIASAGRNQTKKYKYESGNSPQTMMGQPRPWLTVSVSGVTSVNGSQGQNSPFGQGL